MNFESFVLATATADLSVESAAREYADAVEFRMDFADDPLPALASYDGELPLIATNRVAWEGGDAPDTDERLETLAEAAEHEAVAAVDLELRALEGSETAAHEATGVADRAREHGASVIASVHDFEATPTRDELDSLLDRATTHGDVGKLAVTAETPGDVLDLLSVTWDHDQRGHAVATMAMGEAGRHSRAVCPLYGSTIGYAPVDPADATAPGQYDLATLRSLVDRLGSGTI
jgi:3-dehydroquinate dehydratase-1